MITIDLIDEYVPEHEKPAAKHQAGRRSSLGQIISNIMRQFGERQSGERQFGGPEALEAGRIRPVDCARAAHSAMLFWSRG